MAELDTGKPISQEELMVSILALTKLLIEKGLITQCTGYYLGMGVRLGDSAAFANGKT